MQNGSRVTKMPTTPTDLPLHFNPTLDLSFERIVDVPKELVWRAWTEPELLKQWFCPLPWKTIEAEVDLRPGGGFRTTMQSPEGERFPGTSCYLEVLPNAKLVWTNGLLPGYRPIKTKAFIEQASTDFAFTGIITLADHNGGTKYRATVIHATEAECQQHAAMGFESGWGAALDQLVAMVKRGI